MVKMVDNNVPSATPHYLGVKNLGVRMGDPVFKIKDLIKRENISVFSSIYALYGSLSEKVTSTLLSMVPTIETYSIDESFLNLGEFGEMEVEPLARELRDRVHRWVGIPTCVGIAPTETLRRWLTLLQRSDRSTRASVICAPLRSAPSCCPRCPSMKSGASGEHRRRSSPGWVSRRPPISRH